MGNTCCAPADGDLTLHTREFLTMMRYTPSYTTLNKFGFQDENMRNFTSAARSSVFGGSVFSGIGYAPRRLNSLEADIKNQDKALDVLVGGGYYILENVRVAPDTQETMDIYLLTSKIRDNELLKKIKTIHEITLQ